MRKRGSAFLGKLDVRTDVTPDFLVNLFCFVLYSSRVYIQASLISRIFASGSAFFSSTTLHGADIPSVALSLVDEILQICLRTRHHCLLYIYISPALCRSRARAAQLKTEGTKGRERIPDAERRKDAFQNS